MRNIARSLGTRCDHCHVQTATEPREIFDFPSDAKPEKKEAKEMMDMVVRINKENFDGRPVVTCFTCHRGDTHPKGVVPLPTPAPPFPTPEPVAEKPPALESIVAAYTKALGDYAVAVAPKHLVGTRTSADGKTVSTFDMTQLAADRFIVTAKTGEQTMTQVLDAAGGWIRNQEGLRDLRKQERERLAEAAEAVTMVDPATLKSARVTRSDEINGEKAWIVRRQIREGVVEDDFFSAANGTLLRRRLITNSPVGRIPRQTDFSDYRSVKGAMLPYRVKVSFIDPWIGFERTLQTVEVLKKADESVLTRPEK
jgi:hypothetical protein